MTVCRLCTESHTNEVCPYCGEKDMYWTGDATDKIKARVAYLEATNKELESRVRYKEALLQEVRIGLTLIREQVEILSKWDGKTDGN